jgi:hypothetical protein
LPLAAVIILVAFDSCNEYEMYDKEQYKNVFALVSDDGYNIFQVVHDLSSPESVGYVAASLGGTKPTMEDITVTLKADVTAFDKYNEINFGSTKDKFAQLVPADKYSIDSYSFKIAKGERSGRLPIRIRPEGLSPDSTYMIPLKVDKFTAYEVSPSKSNILYQVFIKNRYATQKSLTIYSFTGYSNGTLVMGTKVMSPLTKNRVRIMAGQTAFQSSITVIDANAIVLEVQDDNSVKILPYKTGKMTVEQIDGDTDFPNVFKVETDAFGKTFSTFLLHYKYGGSTEMKEELRLDVTNGL